MKKPIYNFKNETSFGVDLVPDNSFIYIESFNGSPKTVVVLANGLSGTSSVQNLIDQPAWWTDIGAGEQAGEQGGVAWVTGTVYSQGDIVSDTLTDLVYTCSTGHTAGGTFAGDSVKWDEQQPVKQSSYKAIISTSVSGTHDLDFSNGDMQKITVTGDVTISTTNFVADRVCTFILDITNGGDFIVAYPAGWIFDSATAPTLTSGGTDRLLIIKDSDNIYNLVVTATGIA